MGRQVACTHLLLKEALPCVVLDQFHGGQHLLQYQNNNKQGGLDCQSQSVLGRGQAPARHRRWHSSEQTKARGSSARQRTWTMENRSLMKGWFVTLFLMMLQGGRGGETALSRRRRRGRGRVRRQRQVATACSGGGGRAAANGCSSPEAKVVLEGDDAADDAHAGEGVDADQGRQQGQDGSGLHGGAPAGRQGGRAVELSGAAGEAGGLGSGDKGAAAAAEQAACSSADARSPEVVDLLEALEDLVGGLI